MTGTPIGDEVAEFMRHLTHPHLFQHHDAPQPAAATQPAIIATDTPEDHMSFVDTLEADARALVAKFESVDRAALDALEAVQGNPETAAVFSVLASLTRLPLTPGVLTTAIDVLKMTLERASTQPAPAPAEPQAVPAGPVTGGVA